MKVFGLCDRKWKTSIAMVLYMDGKRLVSEHFRIASESDEYGAECKRIFYRWERYLLTSIMEQSRNEKSIINDFPVKDVLVSHDKKSVTVFVEWRYSEGSSMGKGMSNIKRIRNVEKRYINDSGNLVIHVLYSCFTIFADSHRD